MLKKSVKRVFASAMALAMTVGAVQFGGFGLKTVKADPAIIRINCGAGHNGQHKNGMAGSIDGSIGGSWLDQANAVIKNIVPGWYPDEEFIDLNSLGNDLNGANEVYYIQNFVTDLTAENAAPQGIYDSVIQIITPLSYIVPVEAAGAEYTIRLHFGWSGLTWKNSGEGTHRNTIVSVTGGADVALTGEDNDVFNNTAIVRETTAVADANGEITVTIGRAAGSDWGAVINGIELIPGIDPEMRPTETPDVPTPEPVPTSEPAPTLDPSITAAPVVTKAPNEAIRINCGAGHDGAVLNGMTGNVNGTIGGIWKNQAIAAIKNIVPGWLPDDDFIASNSSNEVYYIQNLVTDLTAADAAPQGIYDSMIQVINPLEYVIPAGGQGDEYTVKLHFGWTALTAKNGGEGSHRNTVVYVTSGAPVAIDGADVDVFDKKAIIRTTTAKADENGNITIRIARNDGCDYGAIINGIELIPGIDPGELPTATPEVTPTPETTLAPTPTPEATQEPSVPNQPIRINCGAGHDGTETSSMVGNVDGTIGGSWKNQATAAIKNIVSGWLPDDDFIDPTSISNGGNQGINSVYYIQNFVTDLTATDAAPQGIYDSMIQVIDPLRYIIPAGEQGDEYTVKLHFGWNGIEESHRNTVVYVTGGAPVAINGWDNDVFNYKAIVKTTTATADENGNITIDIRRNDGCDWGAFINGIELIPASAKTGDIDKDGQVNASDLAILLDDYGKTGAFESDLEPDGQVDSADLSLLLVNYGK